MDSKESSPPCLEPAIVEEDSLQDMPTLDVQTDLDLSDHLHDPEGKRLWSVCLSVCLPSCMSVYFSFSEFCLSANLFVFLPVCLSV